jgi:uncharacterized protein (DUF1778 family)
MTTPPKPTGPAVSRYLRNAFAAYLKEHAAEMLLAILAEPTRPQPTLRPLRRMQP